MEPIKLPSFPVSAFHPVLGKRTANSADELSVFEGDPTNWFGTAAEADAARTETEASIVVAHRLKNRLDAALGDDHPVSDKVVENSVQADERIRSGQAEP